MRNKKRRVFLAAFVNQTNAQNLSCRALAKYLDKERFEVYTLQINQGNLDPLVENGVNIFNCGFPVKLTGPIAFIWGFSKADTVYLPRSIFFNWQRFLVKLFNVKSFKTVRNVIDDKALESAMSQLLKPTKGQLRKGFDFVNKVYSMTDYMAEYNERRWGIVSESETLLPPTDFESFAKRKRCRLNLKRLIFIGNDWDRKGLKDFLLLSTSFYELEFHVIGKGDNTKFNNLYGDNVYFHGLLTEDMLADQIEMADLHVLPSTSEGLPRVWLETLSNGLPSILYKGYGAEDYVKPGVSGFVVEDVDEMSSVVLRLTQGEIDLESLSKACLRDSMDFHPRKLTQNYEKVIESLYVS